MSPNQGRRPTSGKGKSGAAGGRAVDPAAVKRLGLLVFGAAFAILFVVVAIAEGIGDPSIPEGDVALVQSTPEDVGHISKAQFARALVPAAAKVGAKSVPKPGDDKYDEVKETALGELLDAAWIQGEAAEMGITVSKAEIAKELKKLKKENFKTEAEYHKFLKQSKYTPEDVNERVKLQILGTQVQSSITENPPVPSGREIENYYAAAKSLQFTTPETRDVRLIANKDQKKVEAAKAQLEKDDSAKTWKTVAKKYSEDPTTKAKGGLQKGIGEGTLEEPLNEQVFSTPEHQLSGPVKTSRLYYIFEVENTTPESVQELSDVEAQIKSQLEQQAQQEQFSAFVTNYSSKWRSRTFCASGFEIERCANFQPAAHSASAPPACYEADPKEPAEACPAPVFQLVPALPGTISPLEPRGKPLAQRPRPAGGESTAETPETLPIPTSP